MWFWIFGTSAVLSALAIALLLGRQIIALRRGQIPVSRRVWSDAAGEALDSFYFAVVSAFRRGLRLASFYTLVLLRLLILLFKHGLTLAERRFARLIEAVRGRGVIDRRGSVSFFLLKLKDNQKKTKQS